MIASNCHGQPSLAPRCTCGQLLILPQVYLDMMFSEPLVESTESPPSPASQPFECLAEG
jgi:hypothetical protein